MGPKKLTLLSCILLMGIPWPVLAKVKGHCADCHTMHNSQGSSPMATYLDETNSFASTEDTTANTGLLKTDCIGCHQGVNIGGVDVVPYVLDISGPNYGVSNTGTDGNTLAGGNFYWVTQGMPRTGHNVAGIVVSGSDVTKPPGGTDTGEQLTCAGTYGCHGSRIADQTLSLWGGHHGNVKGVWKDGTTIAKSYRFLGGPTLTTGTQGLEDPDYEWLPDDGNHNKYYGVDRSAETETPAGTISNHCGRCHTDFHNTSTNGAIDDITGDFDNNVWIRHPTDYDMFNAASSTEYAGYNGGSGSNNTYSVISPVATADDTNNDVNELVYNKADDAIVMCLSCHRAHGTPYDGILRWNYKAWPGLEGYNGCAICHTAKD